jgi:hypothetical protein
MIEKINEKMKNMELNSLESLNINVSDILRDYFFDGGWPKLKARSFMVWTALLQEAVPVAGVSSLSHDRIRKMTGIGSNATVARGICELTEKGYVRALDLCAARNQPAVYQLLHYRFSQSYDRRMDGNVSALFCDAFEAAVD